MSDHLDYTEVTDNTLLPFGDAQIPRGDDNVSVELFIGEIFEDGFRFGSQTFNSMWVATNGGVSFNYPDYSPWPEGAFNISPFYTDLDSNNPPNPDSGVFVDLNTDRDSVVVTWNEIGRYYQNYDPSYTFQLEILDLGDGDAEIIFRYSNMGNDGQHYYSAGATADPGSGIAFNDTSSGIPAFDLDETLGNTGVAGVWQYRIVDGVLEPGLTEDGTDGPDLMEGTLRADVLSGLAGDDTILGNHGNDVLDGGADNDSIDAGSGQDTVAGSDGNDSILGGLGEDQIGGQAGNDTIDGGEGRDTVFGGDGHDLLAESWDSVYYSNQDRIDGGAGNDTIQGAYGNDTLAGQDGDDVLQGGSDRDEIGGGAGDDVIAGGSGNDTMYGGDGDDFIYGDSGTNYASGNAGADTFMLSANGNLRISDFNAEEGDRLIVDGDMHDRSEFFLNPGAAGTIIDSDGNRVIEDIQILYRGADETDFSVIANLDLFAGASTIELRLPSTTPGAGDVIVWDLL